MNDAEENPCFNTIFKSVSLQDLVQEEGLLPWYFLKAAEK